MADYTALRDNLIYVLKESQMKIGYTENAASINYPPASLCRLLGEELSDAELKQELGGFCDSVRPILGEIAVSNYDGQYCLTIPKEGVRYVHEQVSESPFLRELIELVRDHRGKGIDDVLAVFKKYSDRVVVKESDADEYNYVLYFEDGDPDGFVYLVEAMFGHVSYHRMTPADYLAEIK